MKRALAWAILAAVLVVVATVVATRRAREPGGGLTASGTVEATDAQLGFKAAGRIESIAVREGDPVLAGVELARLDGVEMAARRAQAQAQVAAAIAALAELEHGFRTEEVSQARAAHAAAVERVRDAERDRARNERLFTAGAVSREALDKSSMAHEIAKREEERSAEQLRLMEAGPRRERIAAARAHLAEAEARLRAADAEIENLALRSAFDGVVTVRHREPGEVVAAGAPVVTVMNPDDRWVRIFIREDRIGAVHLGQPATITADTYPDRTYPGEVVFIASEAEFTPKSVQTSEERVKLVYALKVRITGDPSRDLKPGVPADVRLDLRAAADTASKTTPKTTPPRAAGTGTP
jgi:HlyD family secretion protein